MAKLRLAIISEYFWPDEAATGRLLGELAERLESDCPNMEITVLTSNRLYRSTNSGSLPRAEHRNRTRIVRLRSLRTGPRDGFVRRAIGDLLFAIGVSLRLLFMRFDCVMAVTNPPLMPLMAAQVCRMSGTPFLYLIHDLYPDVPVATDVWAKDGMFVRLLRQWQGRTLRRAERVIVLGRCMKEYLWRTYDKDPDAITVVPNWYPVTALPMDPTSFPHERPFFDIIYGGNLGFAQDFDTLLDAAELLCDDDRVRFRLIGEGSRRGALESEIARRKLRNVLLEGYMPQNQFEEQLRHASLGVVTLAPRMDGLAVPSKAYHLLALGVPLMAILGPDSEIAHVIRETDCGVVVNHGGSQELAARIRFLSSTPRALDEMSRSAVRYAVENASLAVVAKQYLKTIEGCLHR